MTKGYAGQKNFSKQEAERGRPGVAALLYARLDLN
jgi:hypothetical protein